jgi:cell division protein FtsB
MPPRQKQQETHMSEMPDEIYWSTQWAGIISFHPFAGAKRYVRDDLIAAKDAENDRLQRNESKYEAQIKALVGENDKLAELKAKCQKHDASVEVKNGIISTLSEKLEQLYADMTVLKAENDRLVRMLDTIDNRASNALSGVSEAMKDHDLKAIRKEIQRIREELSKTAGDAHE